MAARKIPKRVVCAQCQNEFETVWGKHNYCSKKCYHRHNNQKAVSQRRQDRRNYRAIAIKVLGNKCKECGFDDVRALQIDHISGGGHKERSSRRKMERLIAIKKAPPGKYQLLCANCNWIKRYENNEIS